MNPVTVFEGTPYKSFTLTLSDTPQSLSPSDLLYNSSLHPRAALVTAESHNVRFTLDGSTPTQGAEGSGAHGHILYASQSIMLHCNMSHTTFVNAEAGLNAVIQITLFY